MKSKLVLSTNICTQKNCKVLVAVVVVSTVMASNSLYMSFYSYSAFDCKHPYCTMV